MADLITSILLIFGLLLIITVYWFFSIPRNLPPGPLGLPFLGSALDFADGSKQHLILQDYANKYGGLFKFYIANKLVLILGDYKSIHEALVKQGDIFAGKIRRYGNETREKHTDAGIVITEGEQWKHLRRFVLSVLRDFGFGRPIIEPQIQQEAESLISTFLTQGEKTPFDPARPLVHATCNILHNLLFGRACDNLKIVQSILDGGSKKARFGEGLLTPFIMSKSLSRIGNLLLPGPKESMQKTERLLQLLDKELMDTKATFDPDALPTNYVHAFMKECLNQDASHYLNEKSLFMTTAVDLFATGVEAVSTALRWAVFFLAGHPSVQDRICEEIKANLGSGTTITYADRTKLPYTEAVMMECLRLGNLSPLGSHRKTLDATKLMGYDIPADTFVIAPLTNVLWNPDYYPDPSTFDPTRFLDRNGEVIKDPKFIPFLAGKRVCPGESMSRLTLFVLIATMVSRLKIYYPPDQPAPSAEPVVAATMAGNTAYPPPYDICVELRDF